MRNSDSDGHYLTGLDAHFSFELTETSQCRAGLRYTTLHVAILLYNEWLMILIQYWQCFIILIWRRCLIGAGTQPELVLLILYSTAAAG